MATPPEVLNGIMIGSALQSSPTANDALANAITLTASKPGQTVWLDPACTSTESIDEVDFQGTRSGNRQYAWPDGFRVRDNRNSENSSLSYNFAAGAAQKIPNSYFHRYDANPSATDQYFAGCMLFSMFVASPGSMAYGSESGGALVIENSIFASKGIWQNRLVTSNKYGIGDFGVLYNYTKWYGGSVNPDDERYVPYSVHMIEGNGYGGPVPLMTIDALDTAPDGTQLLRTNVINGCNEVGAGRYALRVTDKNGVTASLGGFLITGNTTDSSGLFSNVTVTDQQGGTSPFQPQELIGTISNMGVVDQTMIPYNNDSLQTITLTTTITGGVKKAHVVGIATAVCKYRNERTYISKVQPPVTTTNGTITQQITLALRNNSWGGNFILYQDQMDANGIPTGFSQTFGRLSAYDTGIGKSSQCVPVVGALDSQTLILSVNCTQGQQEIPGLPDAMPFAIPVSLNRTNGTVTVTCQTNDLVNFVLNPTCKIINAADASFNTSIAFVPDYNANQQFQYTSAGADGTSTGALSVGAGQNLFTLYHGAEVIRMADPTQTTNSLGTVLGLEPNSIQFQLGDIVEVPIHYSTGGSLESHLVMTAVPANNSLTGSSNISYNGPGLNGLFTEQTRSNSNPASMYQGQGGFLSKPVVSVRRGVWGTMNDWSGVVGGLTDRIYPSYVDDPNQPRQTIAPYGHAVCNPAYATDKTQPPTVYHREYIDMTGANVVRQMGGATFGMRPNLISFGGAPITTGGQPIQEVGAGVNPNDVVTLAQVQAMIAAALAAK